MNKRLNMLVTIKKDNEILAGYLLGYEQKYNSMAMLDVFKLLEEVGVCNWDNPHTPKQLFEEWVNEDMRVGDPVGAGINHEEEHVMELATNQKTAQTVLSFLNDDGILTWLEIDVSPNTHKFNVFLNNFRSATLKFYNSDFEPIDIKEYAEEACGVGYGDIQEWLSRSTRTLNGMGIKIERANAKLVDKDSVIQLARQLGDDDNEE